MILVCGGIADRMIELMCARLAEMRLPFRLLDLGYYPKTYEIVAKWEGSFPAGKIISQDWELEFHNITGIYVRYPAPEERLPHPQVADVHLAQALCGECDSQLMAVLESLPCLVANRMEGGFSNYSKPYQSMLIRQYGLKIPPTLITSDPVAIKEFYERYSGDVIFKSISGIRSIVRRLTPEHFSRLPLVRHGPIQLQALIGGDDIRVHTVDDRYFATRISSSSVDYRYASREGGKAEMSPTELPAAVADSCIRLSRDMGLVVAGIDLKLTPEGDFYCFEINPSPGFLFYEQGTGQAISQALAQVLHLGIIHNEADTDRPVPPRHDVVMQRSLA